MQSDFQEFIDTLSTRMTQFDSASGADSDEKDVVLIIGSTGAGKSTFGNYIIGRRMREEKVAGSMEKGIVCDDPVMEIGHGFVSKTHVPQLHFDDSSRMTFCDCPGFLDTRDAIFDIMNIYAMTDISRRARSVRAVVVVLSYSSLLTSRGGAVSDVCRMLKTLFGKDNYSKKLESVVVLISKAPLNADIDDIRSFLLECPEASSQQIQNVLLRAQLCDPLERSSGVPSREDILTILRDRPELAHETFTFQLAPDSLMKLQSVVHASKQTMFPRDMPLSVYTLSSSTFRASYNCLFQLLHKLRVLMSAPILEMQQDLESCLDRNIRLLGSGTWRADDTIFRNLREWYDRHQDSINFIEGRAHQREMERQQQRARELALEQERERVRREEEVTEARRQRALREVEEQRRREAEARREQEEAERARQQRRQELERAERARREAEEEAARSRRRHHPGQRAYTYAMTLFGPTLVVVHTCCMQLDGSPGCQY